MREWLRRWLQSRKLRLHNLTHIRSSMIEVDLVDPAYTHLGHECYQAHIWFRCAECGFDKTFPSFTCTREWMEKYAPDQLCGFILPSPRREHAADCAQEDPNSLTCCVSPWPKELAN